MLGRPECSSSQYQSGLHAFFYLYIYPPDLQESNGGANTQNRQLPRPASEDVKILLFAYNLIEI